MVKVEKISFAYAEKPVIKDISLAFEAGKFYSILGPNGCGKTTLLDLMIGHLKPISGKVVLKIADSHFITNSNRQSIFIKNINKTDKSAKDTNKNQIKCSDVSREKNILSMSKREVAKYIALVAQNYNINFPFTVKEIVMMGRHPYISRFANPSKEDLDIVSSVMERTGTDTFAHRKITDLSGGERQRCVFARALSQDTPLLFLDEAFSNMDISHTITLLNLVKKEVKSQNRTVVSVFHDINLAAIWSDELIFMKDGQVAACGRTDDVMSEEIIKEVFHVKSKVEHNPYSGVKQAYFEGYR
ncbi:MAG: ABC transporter ATP-binding protein [Desulfamplus sp.]